MKVEQKPQGIKVLKVRIADFGISKQLFQARETMTLIGTPVYMAREMFMGSYDAKVDVYSFGVMIAEAICRRLPRQSEPFTLDELYIHTEDNIVMRALVKVQQNCIQPLPEARPSMEQVVSYLEDIILEYYSGPT
jgi:serine/threonine protein kinase